MTAFIYQLINFLLLVAIVGFFAKKLLDKYFKQQREDLQSQMQSAAADYEKIQQEYELMKDKLQRLEQDLLTAKKDSESSIKTEAEKLKRETDQFISKLSSDLELKLAQETERTKDDFSNRLISEAFALARESLSARLMKEDEAWTSQLVQSELPQGKKNYASK